MLSTCLNSPFVQLQTAEDRCLTTAYFPSLRPTLVCMGRPGANEGTVSHGPSQFCRKPGLCIALSAVKVIGRCLRGIKGNPDGDKKQKKHSFKSSLLDVSSFLPPLILRGLRSSLPVCQLVQQCPPCSHWFLSLQSDETAALPRQGFAALNVP